MDCLACECKRSGCWVMCTYRDVQSKTPDGGVVLDHVPRWVFYNLCNSNESEILPMHATDGSG